MEIKIVVTQCIIAQGGYKQNSGSIIAVLIISCLRIFRIYNYQNYTLFAEMKGSDKGHSLFGMLYVRILKILTHAL